MKRNVIILLAVLLSSTYSGMAQKKSTYQFGYGYAPFVLGQSKVLFIDYNHSEKKIYWGIIGQYMSERGNNILVSSTAHDNYPIFRYHRGKNFVFPELLNNNETMVGTLKLTPIIRFYQDVFIGYHIGLFKRKKRWLFNGSLGLGLFQDNIRIHASEGLAQVNIGNGYKSGVYLDEGYLRVISAEQ